MSELKDLLKYCKDNDIKVIFTDSEILKDYSAMNPEAARAMGFPDIDRNPETKEIEIDKREPKETQVKDLKHELVEMRLMRSGLSYWASHVEALKREKEPFDFEPMPEATKTVSIEVRMPDNKPEKRSWWRRKRKVDNSSASSIRRQ